ncbi:hypothetical protein QTN25_000325 [Entamoeba marina]
MSEVIDVLSNFTYTVDIQRGFNLPKATLTSSTSAYCIIKYHAAESEEKTFQTKPATKTKDPKWKSTFRLNNLSSPIVVVEVHHYEQTRSHSYLGKVVIDLNETNRFEKQIYELDVDKSFIHKIDKDETLSKVKSSKGNLDPHKSYIAINIGRVRTFEFLTQNLLHKTTQLLDNYLITPLLQINRGDCTFIVSYDSKTGYSFGVTCDSSDGMLPVLVFDDSAYTPAYNSQATFYAQQIKKYGQNVKYENWIKNVPQHTELERLCVVFLNPPRIETLLTLAERHKWKKGINIGNAQKKLENCIVNKKLETIYLTEKAVVIAVKENQKMSSIKILRSREDVSNGVIVLIKHGEKCGAVSQFEAEKKLEILEKKKKIEISKVQQVVEIDVQQFPVKMNEITIERYQISTSVNYTYVREIVMLVD